MKKIIVVAFFMMLLCQVCSAAFDKPDPNRWLYLGKTENLEYWLDLETVKFTGNIANVWQQIHFFSDDKKEMNNIEFNMDKRELRILSSYHYDNGSGNAIKNNVSISWQGIIPNTIGEATYNAVLKIYNTQADLPQNKKPEEKKGDGGGKRSHSGGGIFNTVGNIFGI